MKFLLVLTALALCTLASAGPVGSEKSLENWNLFKRTHGKKYATPEEEITRLNIWKTNTDFIDQHNLKFTQGILSFEVGMNQFGDLTNKEFVKIYNGYNATRKESKATKSLVFQYDPNLQVPDSIDWRTQGYVTPVKDQGQCGSCWSFSATGSLEGQHFKASNKLVSLSEQNLVDCSQKYGNEGCNGGLMDQAFSYIKDNKGIDTEASYPYTARDGKCAFNAANVGATDSGFVDVAAKDENALQQAVGTIGPVSVAIDASHLSFQFYKSGIYHEFLCSSTRLDHGVLAVGYGADAGKDYWLVKNSWATVWGDQGYIKMSRNRANNCGIATSASYPTV